MDYLRPSLLLCALVVGTQLCRSQTFVAIADSKELVEQNSKLFHRGGSTNTIDDWVNLYNAGKRGDSAKDIVISEDPGYRSWVENPNEKNREAYLLNAAANSDLIVVAEPLKEHSDLTEDRRFVFTNYQFAVNQVVQARGVTVLPGQSIIVTRPGGTIHYRGHSIIGKVTEFEAFRLNEAYLVFLRLLPNGSFLVTANAAYNLSSNQVDVYSDRRENKNETKKQVPKDQFLEDVNRAIKRVGGAATR